MTYSTEEQTSDFQEEGNDMDAEEGGEDMTGTSEFMVECDIGVGHPGRCLLHPMVSGV